MTTKQRASRKTGGNAKTSSNNNGRSSSTSEGTTEIQIDWKRIIRRMLMMGGIMLMVYLSRRNDMITFVKREEEVEKKSVAVECSKDYQEELKHFPGCVPKNCGRMVQDTIVTDSEVLALLDIAQRGLGLGGSTGGASILDLHSGALSSGSTFVNIYKLEASKRIFKNQDFLIYRHVKNKIHAAIADHFGISKEHLYLTHPTFFSRITNKPAQTIHDEYWHAHVDKETYESFHYTSLLYLTDYGHDFDGGRFIFVDKEGNKTVEPRRGRVSAFTSGSENLHFVEKVTRGTRYAVTVSFTCDPKHSIQDPSLTPQ